MQTRVSRPVRTSLILTVLAASFTLLACASVAAQPPTKTPSGTPNFPAATDPGSTNPGQSGGGSPGTGEPSTGPGWDPCGQLMQPRVPMSVPSSPADPSGTVSSSPTPCQPIYGDGATHVMPVAGVKDARPVAIDHLSIAPNGLTATVYWYGGVDTCYALSKVSVTRNPSGTLVVTVFEGTQPTLPPDTACIDLAQLKATTVVIDQPVFVDGSQQEQKPD